jgi:hypothetical protein
LERAIRAGIRDEQAEEIDGGGGSLEPASGDGYLIVVDAQVLEFLRGELPDWIDLSRLFPDQPPQEWTEPEADASSS